MLLSLLLLLLLLLQLLGRRPLKNPPLPLLTFQNVCAVFPVVFAAVGAFFFMFVAAAVAASGAPFDVSADPVGVVFSCFLLCFAAFCVVLPLFAACAAFAAAFVCIAAAAAAFAAAFGPPTVELHPSFQNVNNNFTID